MEEHQLSIIIIIFCNIIAAYFAYHLVKYIGNKYWTNSIVASRSDAPNKGIISKKHKLIIILVPFGIASIFAIIYLALSEKKFYDFIIYGSISAIVNLIIMFIIFNLYKDVFIQQWGGNYSIAVVYIFTLLIPFFIFFVFVSQLFSGHFIPFEY